MNIMEPKDSIVEGPVCVFSRERVPVNMYRREDILYPMFPLVLDQGQRFNDIKNLQLREKDVIVCGYPRSGNHWLYEVVHMLLSDSVTYSKDAMAVHALLEGMSEDSWQHVKDQTTPRHLATHMTPCELPENLTQSGAKVVCLIRNPKDVFVSLYNMAKEMKHIFVFDGDWPDFFNLCLDGKCFYNSWFDHMARLEKFQKKHPKQPMYLVSYERMKLNPVEEIRRLAKFLGRGERLASHISTATKFDGFQDSLRKAQDANDLLWGLLFKDGAKGPARKGVIGDWRNWFTTNQNDIFDRIFAEKMANSPYTSLVVPYMGSARL